MKPPRTDLSLLSPGDAAAVRAFRERARADLGERIVGMHLYGSKVRGEDTEESDIDVLVVVDRIGVKIERRVIDHAFDVNLEHDVFISPVIVSRARYEDPVWRISDLAVAVEREGIPL